MSRGRPAPGCHEIELATPLPLSDTAEVALEDYARVVARAAASEAVREPAGVTAVHVCGASVAPTPAVRGDLRAFAEELSAREQGTGLGWQ